VAPCWVGAVSRMISEVRTPPPPALMGTAVATTW
jgi:hypothetical protein